MAENIRLWREEKTVEAMIELYCAGVHKRTELCPECLSVLEYARKRLARCPFGEKKPKCSACKVHCYAPVEREQIKNIMRYSGPKMLLRRPVLAIRHLMD